MHTNEDKSWKIQEKDKRRQELENPREKASPFPPDKKKNEKYSKKRPALSIT
jgi:hypothetical protein